MDVSHEGDETMAHSEQGVSEGMGDSFLHEDVGGGTVESIVMGSVLEARGESDSLVAGHWGRWSMRRQGKVEWTVLRLGN